MWLLCAEKWSGQSRTGLTGAAVYVSLRRPFCSKIVFLCFHLFLVSVLFTGPSLIVVNFYRIYLYVYLFITTKTELWTFTWPLKAVRSLYREICLEQSYSMTHRFRWIICIPNRRKCRYSDIKDHFSACMKLIKMFS